MRSKDTTDMEARQRKMEGKQLRTLGFPQMLNQDISLSTQSHATPRGPDYKGGLDMPLGTGTSLAIQCLLLALATTRSDEQ